MPPHSGTAAQTPAPRLTLEPVARAPIVVGIPTRRLCRGTATESAGGTRLGDGHGRVARRELLPLQGQAILRNDDRGRSGAGRRRRTSGDAIRRARGFRRRAQRPRAGRRDGGGARRGRGDAGVLARAIGGPIGTPVEVRVTGLGWRTMDSTYVVSWDNAEVGWVSGVSTKGTAVARFRASGTPGDHPVKLYTGWTGPFVSQLHTGAERVSAAARVSVPRDAGWRTRNGVRRTVRAAAGAGCRSGTAWQGGDDAVAGRRADAGRTLCVGAAAERKRCSWCGGRRRAAG